jgi:hypothetical protein
LLQSLRDTQLEHGERLGRLDARLDGVESRLGGLDVRLDGVESRLGGLDVRLDGVESRLGGLDVRLDRVESGVGSGFGAVGERLDVIVELLSRDAG